MYWDYIYYDFNVNLFLVQYFTLPGTCLHNFKVDVTSWEFVWKDGGAAHFRKDFFDVLKNQMWQKQLVEEFVLLDTYYKYRGGSRDFEKGWHSMSATIVGWRRHFRFLMVWKGQNKVRNYKFLAKYFYQYFEILPIFIHNESLPMKSYQFFKTCKRIDKEREKLRKVGLCFITGYFVKSFNMIMNLFFCFTNSFAPQL